MQDFNVFKNTLKEINVFKNLFNIAIEEHPPSFGRINLQWTDMLKGNIKRGA